ncbi:MAG: hypothetical protein ACXWWC_09870 [Chitinophagaceae bacterium]
MNWPLIIIIGIAFIALIVFLVMRNQKDKREFENRLNHNYRKTKDGEGDTEIDEVMK